MANLPRLTHARRAGILAAAALVCAAVPTAAQASAVNLGTAAPFVVLGGSTVTNTGPSVLNVARTVRAAPHVVHGPSPRHLCRRRLTDESQGLVWRLLLWQSSWWARAIDGSEAQTSGACGLPRGFALRGAFEMRAPVSRSRPSSSSLAVWLPSSRGDRAPVGVLGLQCERAFAVADRVGAVAMAGADLAFA